MFSMMQSFKWAYKCSNHKKYMGVAITIGDSVIPELIINLNENFESKMKYYISHYDDNLVHKFSKDTEIKIQKFIFSDSIDEIVKFLEV